MNSNLIDKEAWITADMAKFVVFIMSHGRAKYAKANTYKFLRSCGYTGKVIVICDNEDSTIEEYYKEFGKENVYVFDKIAMSKRCDTMNNFGKRNGILYARNICFDIARELGYEYFQQLDDDYYYFGHKPSEGSGKKTICYNIIAKWFIEFLLNTDERVKSIAFAQGGDHIGGYDGKLVFKRKAMNSFFCLTQRRFWFSGIFNDDVNTYTVLSTRGDIFLTYMPFKLDQADSQQQKGGITDLYKDFGTYVKSFTTVMAAPSCVQVRMMGANFYRLHHNIKWGHCAPRILSEEYKKK